MVNGTGQGSNIQGTLSPKQPWVAVNKWTHHQSLSSYEPRLTSGPVTMQSPGAPDRQEWRGRGGQQWMREEVTTRGTRVAKVAWKR